MPAKPATKELIKLVNTVFEMYSNAINSKLSKPKEESKKQWYIKLFSKLMRIKHGTHLSLDEYIEEVKGKIKPLLLPPTK